MTDFVANFTLDEGEEFDAILKLDVAPDKVSQLENDMNYQTGDEVAASIEAESIIINDKIDSVTGALADSITGLDNKYDSITGALSDSITGLDNKYDSITGALDDKIDSINGALSDSITGLDNKYDSITGGLDDSITALDSIVSGKADTSYVDSITGALSDSISAIDSIIGGYGDIVNYNAADFADSAQGALADTALQPNDNISELNNDAGYITSSAVKDGVLTIQKNGTNVATFSANSSTNETANITVPTQASDIGAMPDSTTINDLTTEAQQNALNSGATTTNIGQIATNTQAISDETTARENADIGLQNQIDAIVSSSDVFDIVGTYAELQAYDISTVPVNDIIKVLVDSTHNDAATYYRCVENGSIKSWSYIGSEGAYYTKGEADAAFVPQTRTVNNKALSSNITLDASDVGALPDNTIIGSGVLTIQKNGTTIDTFGANDTGNTTVNVTITSSDVTDALGYTPYNSSNPSGYQANVIEAVKVNGSALTPDANKAVDVTVPTNYVTTDTDQNITGTKTYVGQKKIAFKQSSSSDKLGFTLYNNSGIEKGYLEFNPSNTVDSVPLMTLGNYASAAAGLTHVGFRKYSSISGASGAYNLLAPLISDARTPFSLTTTYTNFYLPLGFTDGVTTVKTAKTGLVNISSLLPTVINNLSGLSDVSVSNPSQGQNLTYDSSLGKWKNTTISATVAWGAVTGNISDQTDLYNILAELSVNQSLEDYLDLIIAGQTANLPIVITNPYNQSIADIITGA